MGTREEWKYALIMNGDIYVQIVMLTGDHQRHLSLADNWDSIASFLNTCLMCFEVN